MTPIKIESITKSFHGETAVDAVSLDLASGSFTALLGPSGCGKTTLLRLIAGFERPDAGRILFNERTISDARAVVPPEERNVGVVFQSYALWPHLSVAGNVAYPLKMRGVGSAEIERRVAEALATVELGGFDARDTADLSGGQRQRVALARCLVAEADVIVFDEPLANLDVHLRAAMLETFRQVHRATGRTIVYVTHDQAEALALADRVAVMDHGKLLQFSTPEMLYRAPATGMVARFIGRGGVISAEVTPNEPGRSRVICGQTSFFARSQGQPQGPADVLLRPEALRLVDAGSGGIAGLVRRSTYHGPAYEIEVAVAGGRLVVDAPHALALGSPVSVAVDDAWVVPDPKSS
ncbi:spermidine/putrescine ABC transporter ATP-binding protein [Xaviernesmea oryzae]|uniref:Spermidine/putrescine ABC transporter ATP-binding protein n=1 Tax=Xaviernesmea oryzae TaxID=464029 RepID=A0A1Q9ATN9_9HYPH|nr:ABC transporter ATP-binding protein [Xaviernesmea oryzae]OLP58749.1 spermidine/putrescine ABC transporter ATP-binding protein [Xaviernesmea oryzae]SEK71838.1 iron(III) transport system ATP-binding protein [Xaviernesmea oryzae]